MIYVKLDLLGSLTHSMCLIMIPSEILRFFHWCNMTTQGSPFSASLTSWIQRQGRRQTQGMVGSKLGCFLASKIWRQSLIHDKIMKFIDDLFVDYTMYPFVFLLGNCHTCRIPTKPTIVKGWWRILNTAHLYHKLRFKFTYHDEGIYQNGEIIEIIPDFWPWQRCCEHLNTIWTPKRWKADWSSSCCSHAFRKSLQNCQSEPPNRAASRPLPCLVTKNKSLANLSWKLSPYCVCL